jgi:GTP cyclohydrolase I
MSYDFVKARWNQRYDTYDNFEKSWTEYNNIKPFLANSNIFEDGQTISDEAHFIMRLVTQYHLTEAFKAMKMDLNDNNICENFEDENIGTPGRLAKIWCGSDLKDTSELGSGRWCKPPRMAKFENLNNQHFVIEKTIELTSSCSHHFLPFSTLFSEKSYCVVKYIPKDYVIGISKLKRFINDFVAKRFFLQEDLTRHIGEAMQKITQSDDVYVKLCKLEHSCEKFRGAKDSEGGMTTVYATGKFLDE